mmetsp:Transcript_53031/g.141775  ORF Transcript_53031/g.141775 Transcript_53031/m.141775 type:complete len:218 (-) Transcript_53031:287-940(-)
MIPPLMPVVDLHRAVSHSGVDDGSGFFKSLMTFMRLPVCAMCDRPLTEIDEVTVSRPLNETAADVVQESGTVNDRKTSMHTYLFPNPNTGQFKLQDGTYMQEDEAERSLRKPPSGCTTHVSSQCLPPPERPEQIDLVGQLRPTEHYTPTMKPTVRNEAVLMMSEEKPEPAASDCIVTLLDIDWDPPKQTPLEVELPFEKVPDFIPDWSLAPPCEVAT